MVSIKACHVKPLARLYVPRGLRQQTLRGRHVHVASHLAAAAPVARATLALSLEERAGFLEGNPFRGELL